MEANKGHTTHYTFGKTNYTSGIHQIEGGGDVKLDDEVFHGRLQLVF
jgi:hypothetical protein